MKISLNKSLNDCRFCCVVSKTNGEDPIGSAGTFDHWLLLETTPPWAFRLWMEPNPITPEVLEVLKLFRQEQLKFRPLAIAPDREYSDPDYTRVIYYQRPARAFANYEKFEYVLPQEAVAPLIIALVKQRELLPEFEQYRQASDRIRDLLVCTHGNFDVACARFGYPIYEALRQDYAATSGGQLRVWRCSHFGGHQFAPTLVDLPGGHYWGHLEPEVLELLVKRNGPITQLRRFYRGWSGLTQFEQIVEREIWMQEGWKWLDYHKAGQVLAIDTQHEEWEADWAEVRIDFAAPDDSIRGAYEARVEVCGSVTSAWTSGDEESIYAAKQYRVSHLAKVA